MAKLVTNNAGEDLWLCPRCGEAKTAKEYYTVRGAPGPYCKECTKVYQNTRSKKRVYTPDATLDIDYDRMWREQGGVCAICGKAESNIGRHGRAKRLAVDHDHNTGKVRGLLCQHCNQGLGHFRDSFELLYRAGAYVQKWQGIDTYYSADDELEQAEHLDAMLSDGDINNPSSNAYRRRKHQWSWLTHFWYEHYETLISGYDSKRILFAAQGSLVAVVDAVEHIHVQGIKPNKPVSYVLKVLLQPMPEQSAIEQPAVRVHAPKRQEQETSSSSGGLRKLTDEDIAELEDAKRIAREMGLYPEDKIKAANEGDV